ncbi:MAG TPA: hypothetical protein VFV54_07055 [Thermoanaerobaculia bacterium]|nr:hypothetical protein [Thermoanaerobaculia bacterium]
MTRIATCIVSALLATSALAAEPQKAPAKKPGTTVLTEAPATGDSPLVRAAKAAKKARDKNASPTPTITDASVKKSSGKLTVLSEGKGGTPSPEETESAFAKLNQDRADQIRQAAVARDEVAALEKEVTRLEKELVSVEEDYYDESNAELREDLSQRDFAKTKKDLESAREKLAAARKRHDALSKLTSNVYKP